MYLIVVTFPLFGAILSSFFSKFFGEVGCRVITTSFIFISFFIALLSYASTFFFGSVVKLSLVSWFSLGSMSVSWGFFFDSLSSSLLVVITFISFLVHLYSCGYIEGDPHVCRFISYLSYFSFFMIILVTADNLVQIFVGWEGVGLCSFLLINFWFVRIQANKAAIKAIVINRVGDFGLVLGLLFCFYFTGTLSYFELFLASSEAFFSPIEFFSFTLSSKDFLILFLFVGVIGKSAQLGLHTWLPDAIEGPTPVSALIHAATIVTAGVFVLARCSSIFEISSEALQVISFFGASTAFFGASTGVVQNDLKKIIAYSTCSQLGYIVFSCGFSSYSAGVFHLVNHAFFKALLFLGAGSVIHALSDEQDLRKIGGLFRLLPFTYTAILTGSLSLGGFPYLTGFYSKDAILEACIGSFTSVGFFCSLFGLLAAFCTSFYSVKLLVLSFFNEVNGSRKVFEKIHEPSLFLTGPLFILSIFSIIFGFLIRDFYQGPGTPYYTLSIYSEPINLTFFYGEFLPSFIKLLPFWCGLFGFSFFFLLYKTRFFFFFHSSFFFRRVYLFFNRKWFFDKVYNEILGQFLFKASSYKTYFALDRGFFELVGPFGVSFLFKKLAKSFNVFASGQLFHYLLLIFQTFLFFIVSLFLLKSCFFYILFNFQVFFLFFIFCVF